MRHTLLLGLLLTYALLCATSSFAADISFEEFTAMPQDAKKAMLIAAVKQNRELCQNVSAKTTTSKKIVDMDPKSKAVKKLRQDLGRDVHELLRLEKSYRLTRSRWRVGDTKAREVTVAHYDADSGVKRSRTDTTEAGYDDKTYGSIDTEHTKTGMSCRFACYLGCSFLLPKEDYLGILLDNVNVLQFGEVNEKDRTIEVKITPPSEAPARAVERKITMWFAPEKGFMLASWTLREKASTGVLYYNSEVQQSREVDGLWLPTQLKDVAWTSESEVGPVGNVTEVVVENISVGKVQPKDLEVVFPPGALVSDRILGKRYIIGESGKHLPLARHVTGDASPEIENNSGNLLRWILIGLAGVLLVLACVTLYLRRTKTR